MDSDDIPNHFSREGAAGYDQILSPTAYPVKKIVG